jgi:tetratricopeptide (TPR) repeat protein
MRLDHLMSNTFRAVTRFSKTLGISLIAFGCTAGVSVFAQTDESIAKPIAAATDTNLTEIATNEVTSAVTNAAATNEVEIPLPKITGDYVDTNNTASLQTNGLTPEPGSMPTPGILTSSQPAAPPDGMKSFQEQLATARKQRSDKGTALAAYTLIGLLETNAPLEWKRPVLLELALVAQDANQPVRAQQIFGQYLQLFPNDPSAPEVLLRQGLLYRQMGINSMAISKFYAVMSTALKLKLDNMEYYRNLVLQAQVEIADTYYLEGRYEQAADYFSRLIKAGAIELDKAQIQFKLIRSLSNLTNQIETVAKAQVYLDMYPASQDIPEVRFLLATALKKMGRNQESMKQVLLLLQSQQENIKKNPEAWAYWQRRAGNEIASQLYHEGDLLNALEIYLSLADLDKSPAWQLPVWYQTGLVYEQYHQPQKAADIYQRILSRRKELSDQDASPALLSVFDMAAWRKDHLAWMEQARISNMSFQKESTNDPAPPAAIAR